MDERLLPSAYVFWFIIFNLFFIRKNAEEQFGAFPFSSIQSLCLDCVNGASVFARATIYTFVVDYVNTVVAQGNSTYGAGISARAASQTFVRNYVSHLVIPPFCFRTFIITYFFAFVNPLRKSFPAFFIFFTLF